MNLEESKEWARKLLENHKNPLIKVELPGNKFFLPSNTESEKETINNVLDNLTNIIQIERVERRCVRAIANWLPVQKQAEVVKVTGISNSFGFANKNGKFLYPEEALYLLETNRLELQWNKLPLSIQQAFGIILANNSCNLGKYLIYRKLLLNGFRLLREVQLHKYETGEPPAKKICLESQSSEEKDDANNDIKNIFNKLKCSGPRRFQIPDSVSKGDMDIYKLFLPKNTNKALPDFNLIIHSQDKYLDPALSLIKERTPTIVGYVNPQFVGFYCMESVEIPDLT